MKKVLLLVCCSTALLFACQNNTQIGGGSDSSEQSMSSDSEASSGGGDSSSASSGTVSNVPDTVKRCYQYVKNRDTVHLQVMQMGSDITGTMKYNLYEKDGNNGSINGTAVGDTLVVKYTFQSEGTISTREEILIKQGDGYAVAIGNQQMKGDQFVFTDRTKIKPGPIVLASISCNQ